MNQTPIPMNMVPMAGVSEGMAAGVKVSWMCATDNATRDAALANAVATYPLSNADLLRSAERCKPPQSWYDEDHDGLY